MPSPPAAYLPDILEEHVDELAFLWGQRQTALRDADYTLSDLRHLEERIAAHRDGLLTVGDALPLLEQSLAQDDPLVAFAAAFALLHSGSPSAAARAIEAYRDADAERRAALEEALRYGPLGGALPSVEELSRNGSPALALSAATVLAFQGAPPPNGAALRRFFQDADARVRRDGWRLAGYLGTAVDPKTYAGAIRDEDPAVRRAALDAGAWCGERGVVAVCRKLATQPSPDQLDALQLLAILGGPEDVPLVGMLARTATLGAARFDLVGTFGHPALMDVVLAALVEPDPAIAAAAGAAFTKMTGQNVDSAKKATLPPENGREPDEFEAEFQEEVTLPDPDVAHRHWKLVKPVFQQASRLRRGFDIGGALTPEVFAALDMESRWEILLRARFQGRWSGSPLRLERFPQGGDARND